MWKLGGDAGCPVRLSIRLPPVHKGRIPDGW